VLPAHVHDVSRRAPLPARWIRADNLPAPVAALLPAGLCEALHPGGISGVAAQAGTGTRRRRCLMQYIEQAGLLPAVIVPVVDSVVDIAANENLPVFALGRLISQTDLPGGVRPGNRPTRSLWPGQGGAPEQRLLAAVRLELTGSVGAHVLSRMPLRGALLMLPHPRCHATPH